MRVPSNSCGEPKKEPQIAARPPLHGSFHQVIVAFFSASS